MSIHVVTTRYCHVVLATVTCFMSSCTGRASTTDKNDTLIYIAGSHITLKMAIKCIPALGTCLFEVINTEI